MNTPETMFTNSGRGNHKSQKSTIWFAYPYGRFAGVLAFMTRGQIETSTAKPEVAAIAGDILVASWQSITASSMKKVKP